MKENKIHIAAMSVGAAVNFVLFAVKLYIGISSNSLSVYLDAINNAGDILVCIIALISFILIKKLGGRESARAQSLCSFVVYIVITVTGCYFIYNGIERIMYPMPVSYTYKYAAAISATIPVKILLGLFYRKFNKKAQSPVLSALERDSFLDCFVTLFSLMSIILVPMVQFAADGIFAVITGSIITVGAVKNVKKEILFLVRD